MQAEILSCKLTVFTEGDRSQIVWLLSAYTLLYLMTCDACMRCLKILRIARNVDCVALAFLLTTRKHLAMRAFRWKVETAFK